MRIVIMLKNLENIFKNQDELTKEKNNTEIKIYLQKNNMIIKAYQLLLLSLILIQLYLLNIKMTLPNFDSKNLKDFDVFFQNNIEYEKILNYIEYSNIALILFILCIPISILFYVKNKDTKYSNKNKQLKDFKKTKELIFQCNIFFLIYLPLSEMRKYNVSASIDEFHLTLLDPNLTTKILNITLNSSIGTFFQILATLILIIFLGIITKKSFTIKEKIKGKKIKPINEINKNIESNEMKLKNLKNCLLHDQKLLIKTIEESNKKEIDHKLKVWLDDLANDEIEELTEDEIRLILLKNKNSLNKETIKNY